jgi:hypothetical protein
MIFHLSGLNVLDDNLFLLMEHCIKFQHFFYLILFNVVKFFERFYAVRVAASIVKADLLR